MNGGEDTYRTYTYICTCVLVTYSANQSERQEQLTSLLLETTRNLVKNSETTVQTMLKTFHFVPMVSGKLCTEKNNIGNAFSTRCQTKYFKKYGKKFKFEIKLVLIRPF